MYQQYDPPDDSCFEGGPSDDLAISALEQRLKQIRPRQPHLDIAAIERIVMQTERPVTSNFSMKRFAGVIAASWLIGVAVGTSCVFYLTARHQHAVPSQETIAINNSNAISPTAIESPSLDQPDMLISNIDSLAEVSVGRLVANSLDFDLNSGHLYVGSSLRSHGRLVRTNDFANAQLSIQREDDSIEIDASLSSKFSPPLPVTRAELMRELLKSKKSTIR